MSGGRVRERPEGSHCGTPVLLCVGNGSFTVISMRLDGLRLANWLSGVLLTSAHPVLQWCTDIPVLRLSPSFLKECCHVPCRACSTPYRRDPGTRRRRYGPWAGGDPAGRQRAAPRGHG